MNKRFITYVKGDETMKIEITWESTTDNPDPEHIHEKMLKDGWNPSRVDPLPGVTMKYWRPNHRSYGSSGE